MNKTAIEWCDFTWNPVVGCTHGCSFCYASRQAKRFKHKCQKCYDFVPHLHPERLDQPAKRKKPARIFVCSMGELFDPLLHSDDRLQVYRAMMAAPWHTYIVLTKQPEELFYNVPVVVKPNWWLLTSITNQADADKRIPQILKLKEQGWPVVGVSCEPALGPVDFWKYPPLDWIIVGALTGGRRRTDAEAVAELNAVASGVHGAREMGVPLFVKDNAGWPEQIREYPREANDGG